MAPADGHDPPPREPPTVTDAPQPRDGTDEAWLGLEPSPRLDFAGANDEADTGLAGAPPPVLPAETGEQNPLPAAAQAPVLVRSVLREWADAIVIAVVIAMFLRVFFVELYQIPSGSMTPTLIGGEVLYTDYNGDGLQDLLMLREPNPPLLFMNDGQRLLGQGPAAPIDPAELDRLRREHKTSLIFDRILVNKLAYWLATPRRGDIVVFKTPVSIWDPLKPVYIKRCVGEPGDVLTFDETGRLMAGGQPVTQPAFFRDQTYRAQVNLSAFDERKEVEYDSAKNGDLEIERIHVPMGEIYTFGDNTWSSSDSRYWGGVPLDLVRGRAFLCYWPPQRIRLFHRN